MRSVYLAITDCFPRAVAERSRKLTRDNLTLCERNPDDDPRYPKHVWSPAGGWYAQPANWRANTLIAGAVMFGNVAITWKFSAERETWARRAEPTGWYPSRKYVTAPKSLDANAADGKNELANPRQLVEAIDPVGQGG